MIDKELFDKASKIHEETGRDIVKIYAELANAEIVTKYSRDVMKKLNKSGYKFQYKENNIFLYSDGEKKILPMMKKAPHFFTKANMMIENLNEFCFDFIDDIGTEEEKEEIRREIEAKKRRENFYSQFDRAHGVIEYCDNENKVEKMAKDHNVGLDLLNEFIGDGCYFHSFATRTGIDDYILFGIITKGKRDRSDLNLYVQYRYKIFDIDFSQKRECWECGNTFTFEKLKADNTEAPAWEQIRRKIDMWEDYYCGC